MQAIRQLEQHDARLLAHRQEELANRLDLLARFAVALGAVVQRHGRRRGIFIRLVAGIGQLDGAELGHTRPDVGNDVAKLFPPALPRAAGILPPSLPDPSPPPPTPYY